MKILHVIPSYEPAWAAGGTVTATSNLCRALARQDIDMTVYTTDVDGNGGHLDVPLNEPVDLGGVRVWYFRCDLLPKKAFYSGRLAKKLKETVKTFDLVHMSAIWQWIGVDVFKVCKHVSKPYIVSVHGSFNTWCWNQNIIQKRFYWHLIGKKAINSAHAIHFTVRDEQEKSLSTLPFLRQKENFVIPNGIVLKEGKNIRDKLGFTSDQFILLFVGRIHRKKGIHLVIEAMKRIDNKNIRLLLVGSKEDKDYVSLLGKTSKEVEDKILWHDTVPVNEIWDYYSSSTLFVLPSHDENFGMVVVEAMACGLPVLVSKNVGIWREVESDGAGVAVNQDVDEIAEAIKKLADDTKLLNKMKHNARKSAEKRYDINKVASLMIKAYEDVLTGRKSLELQWE
jgi:glycosyltransferase involved in cell wall biosynthesis